MGYFEYYEKLNNNKFKNINNEASKSIRDHILEQIITVAPEQEGPRKLSDTEKQICVGLALGLSAKEIAKARGSSNRTIETHIANIKIKVGCKRLPPVLLMVLIEKYHPISATDNNIELA